MMEKELNLIDLISFFNKINLLYRMNDYFSIHTHLINKLNEWDCLDFKKDVLPYNEDQNKFFLKLPVIFRNSKKINNKKNVFDEYFGNLLVIKNTNPNVFSTIDKKITDFFNDYKDNENIVDDEKSKEDLILLNNALFRNIIGLPKNYNNFFLVLIENIIKKILNIYKDNQNIFNYPELLTNLYYSIKLLILVSDYEAELWSSLDQYINVEKDNLPTRNKLDTIMGIPVSKIKQTLLEFKNNNYEHINKKYIAEFLDLVPELKLNKYKVKIGDIMDIKELNDNDEFEYKRQFMLNRLMDILFAAKMILFQDYHFNINYYLDEYYISFIKNYYRFYNCLRG